MSSDFERENLVLVAWAMIHQSKAFEEVPPRPELEERWRKAFKKEREHIIAETVPEDKELKEQRDDAFESACGMQQAPRACLCAS